MKSAMSKLELEITKLCAVTPKKKEERQGYLKRIAVAVDKMDTKKYNKLSPAAQTWYESAVAAANIGEELPDFVKAKKVKEEKKPVKLTFKKKRPPVPTWRELKDMDEDDLSELAESFEIDLDSDFDDIEEVQKYIANELKIKKPGINIKKAVKEESKLPGWNALHRMSEDNMLDFIDEQGIKITKEFDSMQEVADFVCDKLKIKMPEGAKRYEKKVTKKKAAPKKKAKAKAKAKKAKPAPKKAKGKPLSWYKEKLHGMGFKGQALGKIMDAVRKYL